MKEHKTGLYLEFKIFTHFSLNSGYRKFHNETNFHVITSRNEVTKIVLVLLLDITCMDLLKQQLLEASISPKQNIFFSKIKKILQQHIKQILYSRNVGLYVQTNVGLCVQTNVGLCVQTN